MSDKAIVIENLWKGYHLGSRKSGSLRETLTSFVSFKQNEPKTFWALKELNLEIKKGEVIGLIGRNGAGKSTLLKVLSRITAPTKGSFTLYGRVSSLLEVGTGFHPELTGRENIFLNGTILGMTRNEIKTKFDEIVAFSGIEKFLETPVKRYSSGMYVRLAFAVAAHLEPEILFIDEVLAVGDAEFQKKCLGKMKDVSRNEGRTVLFVSHNMGAVSQLCNRGVFLSEGKVTQVGNIQDTISAYISDFENSPQVLSKTSDLNSIHFSSAFMCNLSLKPVSEFRHNEDIRIYVELHLPEYNENLELAMRLIDRNKNAVFTIHEKLLKFYKNQSKLVLIIKIPGGFLTPNNFSWIMCVNNAGVTMYDLKEDVLAFTVLETGTDFARYNGADYGRVFANYEISCIQ